MYFIRYRIMLRMSVWIWCATMLPNRTKIKDYNWYIDTCYIGCLFTIYIPMRYPKVKSTEFILFNLIQLISVWQFSIPQQQVCYSMFDKYVFGNCFGLLDGSSSESTLFLVNSCDMYPWKRQVISIPERLIPKSRFFPTKFKSNEQNPRQIIGSKLSTDTVFFYSLYTKNHKSLTFECFIYSIIWTIG